MGTNWRSQFGHRRARPAQGGVPQGAALPRLTARALTCSGASRQIRAVGRLVAAGRACRVANWLRQSVCAPARGLSSAGRAVALQASGHRFDPDRLHHCSKDEDKRFRAASFVLRADWGKCPRFDIVNGFLKSMPWQYRVQATEFYIVTKLKG